MNFIDAIEFSKKFALCRPKIFKGFIEWDIWDYKTDGYVVLTETAKIKKSDFDEMENYAKNHNLKLASIKDYSLISTYG